MTAGEHGRQRNMCLFGWGCGQDLDRSCQKCCSSVMILELTEVSKWLLQADTHGNGENCDLYVLSISIMLHRFNESCFFKNG